MPIVRGSTPAEENAKIRASGFRLFLFTKVFAAQHHGRRAVGDAGGISGGDGAGLRKHRSKLASFPTSRAEERVFVAAESLSAFLLSIVTGTISRSKYPEEMALAARVCEQSAYWSCSSREILYCSARTSAVSPITILARGRRNRRDTYRRPVPGCRGDSPSARHRDSRAGATWIRCHRPARNRDCRRRFLGGQSDGLHARGTGFIDGVSGNFLGHAAANGDLARRIGTAAGLPGVAENSFFDLVGTARRRDPSQLWQRRSHVGGRQ